MPSRDLSLCCSLLRYAIPQFMADYAAEAGGPMTRIIQTERSAEEQIGLYALGRTAPGPDVSINRPMGRTVTEADGVNTLSKHQLQIRHNESACHATDLGVFSIVGVPLWDITYYESFKHLAIRYGLISGWTFPKIDSDHLECDPTRAVPAVVTA